MKKNLNIFISILNISLIFASLEAVHGMEALKPDKQDLKRAYLGTPNNSDITEEPLQKKRKSKDLQENLFERCPEEIKVSFFKYRFSIVFFSLLFNWTSEYALGKRNWRNSL